MSSSGTCTRLRSRLCQSFLSLCVGIFLFSPGVALGWGSIGHRIVARVGSQYAGGFWAANSMGMVNLTFAVVSMFFVDKMGRKPLMLIGSIGMSIAMTLLAVTFISGHAKGYFVLICIMGYLAAFGFSLGPVVWVLIAEIFPNRLRSVAVAIATITLWAADFIVSLTFPYLLKHVQGYSFAIYGSMCVLCFLFCWKYLEETKGKTLEEIEMDFTKSETPQSVTAQAINR